MPLNPTVGVADTMHAFHAATAQARGIVESSGGGSGSHTTALSTAASLWPILASAFFGAFFAFLFTRVGEWLSAKLARGKVHRNALVRLERVTQEYLNEIITNRRLAADSQRATANGHLYWKFPHLFSVDRSFLVDVLDIDMVQRIMGMNIHLSRYNHDVEDLRRTHDDLQKVHLGGNLPIDVWNETMQRESPHWGDLAVFQDDLETEVAEICVRAILLVQQYDCRAAQLQRLWGHVTTWPLADDAVRAERRDFEERRSRLLAASRVAGDEARARAAAARAANTRSA